MNKAPLISIITVNLNNLEGLKKTMTSVFEQQWQEFEYIVIDGGSNDGSKEYLQTHDDKIDHWISEPDEGIYSGMNKGIKAARGEYLLFLNSGDWLFDNSTLELISPHLSDCEVLYGNMVKVFPDEREHLDKGVNGKKISFYTFAEGNLNHQATFIARGLFEKYGLYEENIGIVADWKFFLIALGLNNARVKYLDLPVSYFDMTGISSNFDKRDLERKKILENEVPSPVYLDFLRLKEQERILKKPRLQKFLRTDNKKISRKLHSLIFRIFS